MNIRKKFVLLLLSFIGSAQLFILCCFLGWVGHVNQLSPDVLLSLSAINPWAITGLTDGDGSFNYSVYKNYNRKGYLVRLRFAIELKYSPQNLEMLEAMQRFLDVGRIQLSLKRGKVVWEVRSVNDFIILINHFIMFPLQTTKRAHFEALCLIHEMLLNNEHLTPVGLAKIVALKGLFPKGLSSELRAQFPGVKPIKPVPFMHYIGKLTPGWIAGFYTAEGCFGIYVIDSIHNRRKFGKSVVIGCTVSQHNRDLFILQKIAAFFNGKLRNLSNSEASEVGVHDLEGITTCIIPFFNANPILGTKALDFRDFCEAIKLVECGAHLTEEGMSKIDAISKNMNRRRTVFK